MDSTGLAYRSKDTVLRWRRGQEERRMRGHSRLLALVRWRRGQKLLAPWGGGVLLGDAGFDGREVWEVVRGLGVWPLIRLRGGGEVRDEVRREVAARWDGEVYRRRGVVEGVFGGMKTRLRRGYLQERKPHTAMWRAFMEFLAYGLRILLTLLPPQGGYKAIY